MLDVVGPENLAKLTISNPGKKCIQSSNCPKYHLQTFNLNESIIIIVIRCFNLEFSTMGAMFSHMMLSS